MGTKEDIIAAVGGGQLNNLEAIAETIGDAIDAAVNPTQQSAIASLTDNSGGTPSDTIAVVSETPTQAQVADGLASLAAKVNAIIAALEAYGVIAE